MNRREKGGRRGEGEGKGEGRFRSQAMRKDRTAPLHNIKLHSLKGDKSGRPILVQEPISGQVQNEQRQQQHAQQQQTQQLLDTRNVPRATSLRSLHTPSVADDMSTPVQYSDGKYYYSSVDDGFKGGDDDTANSGYGQYYDDFFGILAHRIRDSYASASDTSASASAAFEGYDTFTFDSNSLSSATATATGTGTAVPITRVNSLDTVAWERKFFSMYRRKSVTVNRSRSQPSKPMRSLDAKSDGSAVMNSVVFPDNAVDKSARTKDYSASDAGTDTAAGSGASEKSKADDEEYVLTAARREPAVTRKAKARLRGELMSNTPYYLFWYK